MYYNLGTRMVIHRITIIHLQIYKYINIIHVQERQKNTSQFKDLKQFR